jgi:hypothetical protein
MLLLLAVFAVCTFARSERLVWMCLERCNDEMKDGLKEIAAHANVLSAVSFEAYDLGSNGSLVYNNFSNPAPALEMMGLERYPMVCVCSCR